MAGITSEELLKTYTKCVNFAAIKHRNQRRLDTEQTPYVNHPIAARLLKTTAHFGPVLLPLRQKQKVGMCRLHSSSGSNAQCWLVNK
uniref:Uncharacterized protein n=1 Tax=Anopheles atroparvus TaxID=41427 RepID=A0AAG5CRB8_ANOAO